MLILRLDDKSGGHNQEIGSNKFSPYQPTANPTQFNRPAHRRPVIAKNRFPGPGSEILAGGLGHATQDGSQIDPVAWRPVPNRRD